jgi:hypothetical protein
MARYRKIDPRLWRDERVRRLNQLEKLIVIYCLTAQSNRVGIFNFSPAMAAEDLEISHQTFEKGFEKVCESLLWSYDKPSRVLYIPTWFKYNTPENPNVLIGCLNDLHELPKTPLLQLFRDNTRYLPKTFHQTFAEGCPKPSLNQEQEKKQKQEQDLPPIVPRGTNGSFSRFWDAYPRKKSKGKAQQAWCKVKPDEQLVARILASIERAKTSDDWIREKGRFIPYPASWLNAQGWEDELPEQPKSKWDQ